MSQSLVSVCIPCFNAEHYVQKTLDCLLKQSWAALEVIVVNDGSTDRSMDVLRPYADRGVRIVDQSQAGQCAAANRALSLASGDYIKFLDADDLISPDFIGLQMARLEGRADAVASAGWGRFYGDDLATFKPNPEPVWRDMDPLDWLIEAWAEAHPMMQCGLFLIPRSLLDRSGGWDESLSLINDFEFFARVLVHSRAVLFTHEATLFYRSGLKGSLSAQKDRKAAESAFHSVLKGTGYLLAHRSTASARRSCANVMQNFIYEFYPKYHDLLGAMEERIAELGGSDLTMPAGPRLHQLQRFLGWKAAKRLQRAFCRT